MPKRSAGILLYRTQPDLEVFLVHPGGPFWVNKDLGAWTVPKGEVNRDEAELDAARREFQEETGCAVSGDVRDLGFVKYSHGKIVMAWAAEGDCDPEKLKSNTCLIEWPPRSGRQLEIPEVDRGAWFTLDQARRRILKAQIPFLDRLENLLPRPEQLSRQH